MCVVWGARGAGARTGAFGSVQIPGIQLKSWLAPLAGRRSRGICIMKIDSSKLPAWQPGRAPAGGGDPAAPGSPAGAPAARCVRGARGRAPRAAERGAAAGTRGPAAGLGMGVCVYVGRSGPHDSRSLFREGSKTLLEVKDFISGHRPPLATFLRLPGDARCSRRAPAILICKHAKGKRQASIIVPRAGRVPIVYSIEFDVLYLIPVQANRQANTECPVT